MSTLAAAASRRFGLAEPDEISVHKGRKASRSYGRGMDNYRIPAHYWVFVGQNKVGFIAGTKAHYMESSTWMVCANSGRELKTFRRLADAKRWAKEHDWNS